MSDHHAMPVVGTTLPAAPAIECQAVPIERPRDTAARAGKWVLVGFLLVLILKFVGLLIVGLWIVRRFPRAVFALSAAIPAWNAIRRGRSSAPPAETIRDGSTG